MSHQTSGRRSRRREDQTTGVDRTSKRSPSMHFVALDHTDVKGAFDAVMRMIAEADKKHTPEVGSRELHE